MPIYVYNCKKCKKEFEVMGKMSDLNKEGYKPECPDCKSKDNEK